MLQDRDPVWVNLIEDFCCVAAVIGATCAAPCRQGQLGAPYRRVRPLGGVSGWGGSAPPGQRNIRSQFAMGLDPWLMRYSVFNHTI